MKNQLPREMTRMLAWNASSTRFFSESPSFTDGKKCAEIASGGGDRMNCNPAKSLDKA
jgi:hypothetical protein